MACRTIRFRTVFAFIKSSLHRRVPVNPPAFESMTGEAFILISGMGRNVAGGTVEIAEEVGLSGLPGKGRPVKMTMVTAGNPGMSPSKNGPGFRMVEILGIKRQQPCFRAPMF